MFNSLFESFLEECFGYSLEELAPVLQYVVSYFALPMSFELPSAALNN
jgi:hypothetical protein